MSFLKSCLVYLIALLNNCLWCVTQAQDCSIYDKQLLDQAQGSLVIYSSTTNSVYLFGGYKYSAYWFYSLNVYKWDLSVSDSWFELIDTIQSDYLYSYGNNAILVDNIIYFIGSYSESNGALFKYDIISETWLDNTELNPPPTPVSHGCLATNHTHAFMVNGPHSTNGNTPVLQIYNIADNTWTSIAANLTQTDEWTTWVYQYCYMADNNLYIFGGETGTDNWDHYFSADIYRYNTATDIWSHLPPDLPDGEEAGGMAVLYDNLIYLVGTNYEGNGHINALNISTNTLYTPRLILPLQVEFPSVVLIGAKIYVFGGGLSSSATNTVQICDLDQITFTTTTSTTTSSTEEQNNPIITTNINTSSSLSSTAISTSTYDVLAQSINIVLIQPPISRQLYTILMVIASAVCLIFIVCAFVRTVWYRRLNKVFTEIDHGISKQHPKQDKEVAIKRDDMKYTVEGPSGNHVLDKNESEGIRMKDHSNDDLCKKHQHKEGEEVHHTNKTTKTRTCGTAGMQF